VCDDISEINAMNRRERGGERGVVNHDGDDPPPRADGVVDFPADLLGFRGVTAPDNKQLFGVVDVSLDLIEPWVTWFEVLVPIHSLVDASQTGSQQRDEASNERLIGPAIGDDQLRHVAIISQPHRPLMRLQLACVPRLRPSRAPAARGLQGRYTAGMTSTGDEPADDTPIWRYTDLARFVYLVSQRRLWFSKLTVLLAGDPYEGYGAAEGLPGIPRVPGRHIIPAEEGQSLLYSEASRSAAADIREAHLLTDASSWCMGPESLGMWMLYGAGGFGVAVRSTIGRCRESLVRTISDDHYRFGPVSYHPDAEAFASEVQDFRVGDVPAGGRLRQRVLERAFNKRIAYGYEQEWRAALIQDRRPEVRGIDVEVDLAVLINQVFVGPKTNELEMDAVRAVMAWGGISGTPVRSTLLSPPSSLTPP